MALDEDIQKATASDLEKIKAQDWRNDSLARRAAEKEHWDQELLLDERRTVAFEEQSHAQAVAVGGFGTEDIDALIRVLAPNYMKPSIATTVGGMTSDIDRDGEFLRLAIRKVLAVRDEFIVR